MKNNILIFIITIFLLSFTSGLKANGKIDSLVNVYQNKRADKAYENMAYIKAINIYEQLIENEYTSPGIYRNVASSYYKTGNTQKAEEYYQHLVSKMKYEPEDVYTYAQCLKYNGNYKQSDIWLKKYASLNVEDSRIERQKNTSEKITNLKALKKYNVEPVSFNSKYADFGPYINGNKLYFASERRDEAVVNYEYAWKEAPYLDIYELDMDKNLISKPVFLKGKINSKFHDGPLCFSNDGKEMFFTRNNSIFRIISKKGNENINNLKIYHSKYTNGELSNPVELPFNSENYSCGHPTLSTDGTTMYFTSDMPGGYGGSDIYMVKRQNGQWSTPENMGEKINTEGDEMFPYIHTSGLLFFASNGHMGLGGLDIFKAEKRGDGYQVENMGYPLNSNKDDFGIIVNDELKEGYFSSNREEGKGDDDIYKFFALDIRLNLQGKIFDNKTKEQIDKPSVVLEDSKGEKLHLMSSSSEFDYKIEVNPNEKYILSVNKDGYRPFQISITPSDLSKKGNTVEYDVFLDKIPVWGIFGKVFFKESLEMIPGVGIKLTNKQTFSVKEFVSDAEGLFRIQLEKETDYELFFNKEGLFSIRADYSTKQRPAGWVNADEFIELAFEKVELNKKIEIPNIYYDLGKWNIREDASIELDKVVQFLNDNPGIKIELGSHTDARGSSKSNQWLSQKRAQSAVDYIVSKGIDRARITAKGYGESQIKNKCLDGVKCTEAEHQENRRTEIRITGI